MSLKPAGGKTSKKAAQRTFVFAALLLAAHTAQANTYLFSVTSNQLLSALRTADNDEPGSAYFAIMLQPAGLDISSYSYNALTAPVTPAPGEAWDAGTITDFSDKGTGTFARFSKQQVQNTTAVLSEDNFDFQDLYYSDSCSWPVCWGPNQGLMHDFLSPTSTFEFVISYAGNLGSTHTMNGIASSAWFDGTSFKTNTNVAFSVDATVVPTAAPEPGAAVLVLIGAVCLAAGRLLQRRRRRKQERTTFE